MSSHPRGIHTLERMRARCVLTSTLCWEWQGALTGHSKSPVFHCLDPERMVKRTMSGPTAAWLLAFGRMPRAGHRIYRACGNLLCLNPVHLRERTPAGAGEIWRATGCRKGVSTPARRAAAAKGRAVQGFVDTPADVVRAVRAAPPAVTSRELAARYGLAYATACRIRKGTQRRLLDEEVHA